MPLDARPAEGRTCPADYRTDPAELRTAPEIVADTLYVVGGLYGNAEALTAVESRAAAEGATVFLNGDAHWFDADPVRFAALDARLAAHPAIRGNIEAELVRTEDVGAGCGCAYPPEVDQGVVDRSNIILARLRDVARSLPDACARMAALPAHAVARVGGVRIGLIHGDPWSLAGWSFTRDGLSTPDMNLRVHEAAERADVDVFASTHTCGAVMRVLAGPARRVVVANNGAAGMATFAGSTAGVVTRIARRPASDALYQVDLGAIVIEAVPVTFDLTATLEWFDCIWPTGSPAAVSYRRRLAEGGCDPVAEAVP